TGAHDLAAARTGRGARVRPVPPDDDREGLAPPTGLPIVPRDRVAAPASLEATPTNVMVNNPAGDAAGTGQAEESVAAIGSKLLVAFNDGQGFVSGNPYKDTQGYAVSTDNGATFVDGGVPPKPAGFSAWVWTSDPITAVNAKTGKYYYCGLASSDGTHNAIGLASGSFSGTSFVWDSVRVVRNELNTNFLLDKPWLAADSTTGNLYVAMTTYDQTVPGGVNWIDFTRSTNGGRTWSTPLQISDNQTNGLVQGARIVAAPAGKVVATWQAIGDTIVYDYLKYAFSTDQGQTFSLETTPVLYVPNFGTGAPGYNRERGIEFPSLAVDNTRGVNRGRTYLCWAESYNHLDDVFTSTSAKSEVEPNGLYGNATPFTPGDILRGSSSSVTDADMWSFNLTRGQAIIVWVDSLVTNATYTVRLFAPAPDSVQRLCYGGDLTSNTGLPATQTYFTFMAPAAGRYYLRFAPASGTSLIGNYRIRTKIGDIGTERGRDQRDVFVTWTDDGNTWSTPARANSDPTGFDDYLPEIAVAPDGCPYVMWRDHRNDVYGSRTQQMIARSLDGGTTWGLNQPISSAIGNFTTALSNLVPNQGDYNGLSGDARYLRAAWADARGASVDVWGTTIDTDFQFTICPPDTHTTAGSQVWARWTIANLNPLYPNHYVATFTSQRNWPEPADSLDIGAASSVMFIPMQLVVPDTAKAGVNRVCMNLRNTRNSKTIQCCLNITVIQGGVSVGDVAAPAFALAAPSPDPAPGAATLRFALSRATRATLSLYDVTGARVRTLVQGVLTGGWHTVAWDGRDDQGRAARAGMYFVQLEAEGRRSTRRFALTR
ncbi:MAG TPA: FlgD immunoglobulin-like domain containing protein, partial [Candidatus Eisenbacteria bacterium]|nr:FlgD immunoglobulin-like domain containing protein [Candidatus Eisenbacteria bacterium]